MVRACPRYRIHQTTLGQDILQYGCSVQSYANIKRENRKWVFAVYKKYIELRKTAGHEYDWDDLALYVYLELQNDQTPRRYTHIIVDEGQDFSPMMIKSLVSATAYDGSFTFFGDVAQQIYGSRLSWRDSGINTDKIWRFNVNYRNPSTITSFAKDITKSEYWLKDEDMVDATAQIAEGPKPILIKFSERSNEKKWIIDRAIALSKTSSVVIICRNRSDIDMFLYKFKKQGCTATEIDKDTAGYADAKKYTFLLFTLQRGWNLTMFLSPFWRRRDCQIQMLLLGRRLKKKHMQMRSNFSMWQ